VPNVQVKFAARRARRQATLHQRRDAAMSGRSSGGSLSRDRDDPLRASDAFYTARVTSPPLTDVPDPLRGSCRVRERRPVVPCAFSLAFLAFRLLEPHANGGCIHSAARFTPTSFADLPAKLDHSERSGVRFRRKPSSRVHDKSGHAVHLLVRRACDGDSHRWGRILRELSRLFSMPGRITLANVIRYLRDAARIHSSLFAQSSQALSVSSAYVQLLLSCHWFFRTMIRSCFRCRTPS
jgi:hypothetical protein